MKISHENQAFYIECISKLFVGFLNPLPYTYMDPLPYTWINNLWDSLFLLYPIRMNIEQGNDHESTNDII